MVIDQFQRTNLLLEDSQAPRWIIESHLDELSKRYKLYKQYGILTGLALEDLVQEFFEHIEEGDARLLVSILCMAYFIDHRIMTQIGLLDCAT
jgi:hypothetical protein